MGFWQRIVIVEIILKELSIGPAVIIQYMGVLIRSC